MSRTTDWVLELEAAGKIEYNGTTYQYTLQDVLDRAEYELLTAQENYTNIKNKLDSTHSS